MSHRFFQLTPLLAALTWWGPLAVSLGDDANPESQADRILAETGVNGGLIVQLGCHDGQLGLALARRGPFLLHCLTGNPQDVDTARREIHSAGECEKVSVSQLRRSALPYADDLVSLLVVDDALGVPRNEMLRVLQPDGVAYIRHENRSERLVKPRPEALDQWTHFLYDASNNAVSQDTVVGPPSQFQWITGPRWARSHDHLASLSAMVSSGGRIFYIVDEAPIAHVGIKPRWFLVARNAFNGVLLWKRKVGPWEGHLRGFRSGPTELARRLVAIDDRVYATLGYGHPISQLDAVSGRTLQEYETTKNALEVVYEQDRLFVVVGDRLPQNTDGAAKLQRPDNLWHWWTVREDTAPEKRIVALDPDDGNVLWNKEDSATGNVYPTTLAVAERHLLFQSDQGIFALDSRTGEERWHHQRPVARQRLTWSSPTLVIHGDVVLSGDRDTEAAIPGTNERTANSPWVVSSQGGYAPPGKLIAYSLSTGEQLWESTCREGYNAAVDLLVANGSVWSGSLVKRNDPGIITGLDLLTGETRQHRSKDQEHFAIKMGHHRCYRNKATERYLILGRDGIEFIDTSTGQGVGNPWVRGSCQYGVMPGNGLIYSPPHSCACHIESKLNSFNALAPKKSAPGVERRVNQEDRLIRGPAYDAFIHASNSTPQTSSWPTYRCDASRSGVATTEIPRQIATTWQTNVCRGRLSSPVVATEKLLVASIDEHRIDALGIRTGKHLWSFTADGRVDSPPTVHAGTALFGCADGWIYCIDVETGELAWRFLAAPGEEQIVVHEQLESAWPLHGSLLIKNDVLFAVAGRTPELEGGLTLYRLNPRTGELLSASPIAAPALPDVLSADDSSIYLRHRRFNLEGVDQKTPVAHLYSPAGFLDDSWWHRTYWMFGTGMRSGWGGWPISANDVAAGRIMVVDHDIVYGFGRLNQYHRNGSHVGLGTTRYKLYAANVRTGGKSPRAVGRRGNPADTGRVTATWQQTLPLMARALLKSAEQLYVAGPPDQLAYAQAADVHPYHIASQAALDDHEVALAGEHGGMLRVVSATDGRELASYSLVAPPVWDGMAAAYERLFVSLTNGQVVCLAGEPK